MEVGDFLGLNLYEVENKCIIMDKLLLILIK